MTGPRLFLNGGGDAPETVEIDRAFLEAVGGGRILYLPFARAPETYGSCAAWFAAHLASLGVTDFELLSSPEPAALSRCAGVYVGGGDTYLLHSTLRRAGFDRALRDAALSGLPIFGGSAGAIVLGADIATWVPEGASRPAVAAAAGLDLLAGYSVWPEYEPPLEAEVSDWISARSSPVLGLSARAGIIVDGTEWWSCGQVAVVSITRSGSRAFLPGARIEVGPAS